MKSSSSAAPITVLTSATGLGVYIPGLLVRDALRRGGMQADIEVLENYYDKASRLRFLETRKQFRSNFGLALIGHRMARPVGHCLENSRVDELLDHWLSEDRRQFATWSGYWLPILAQYRRLRAPEPVETDLCRIDARRSASFEVHAELESGSRSVWFWNAGQASLDYELPVAASPAIGQDERPNRLLFHGGGWGLGEYRSKLAGAAAAGFELDVVIHQRDEQVFHRNGDRCYMIDGDWQPWDRNPAGENDYPPMLEIDSDGNERSMSSNRVHAMNNIARRCKAIVSKPGGCTLIDSLSTQTPLLWLTPYGYAEQANADLWQSLGFGMAYESWSAGGFDSIMLERMHTRLRQPRTSTRQYPDINRLRAQMQGP